MEAVTVHNSSRRSWSVALSGVILAAVALDLLIGTGLVAALAERAFEGEEVLEARERVWGGILMMAGGTLTVWGVLSGIRFRPVLRVAPEGLHLALRGPFRSLHLIGWDAVEGVFAQPVTDDGTLLPCLTIVLDRSHLDHELPQDPWAARWSGPRILRVLTSDWSVRAEVVAKVSEHYLRHESEPTEVAQNG